MNKKLVICALLSVTIVNAGPYIHFREPIEALKIVEQYLPECPIILEGGAYDGNDTLQMFKFFARKDTDTQKTQIHSFEPIAYLRGLFIAKTKRFSKQIHPYPHALSDTTGEAVMYVSEEAYNPDIPSMSSSLLPPKEHLNYSGTLFKKTIAVPTITIDEWAEANGIDHIDFIWMDIQGKEGHVLKASPKMLKTVKAILMEVEFVEAYKGQDMFQDIKDFLEAEGFTMIAENFGTHATWFGDALFVRKP